MGLKKKKAGLMLVLDIVLLFPARASWAGEKACPSVKDLVKMVTDANGIEPARFKDLATRAGNAGWLPLLEIRVDRNLDGNKSGTRSRSVSVSSSGVYLGPDDETFVFQEGDDWRIRIRAVWELDRLVYDRDELKALDRELKTVEARNKLLKQALDLYFKWKNLIRKLAQEEGAENRIHIHEALDKVTAMLDVLTLGRFSKAIGDRRKAKPGKTTAGKPMVEKQLQLQPEYKEVDENGSH
ncbi:MAG: hypothetical protein GXP49_10260 [Deltaproteobacteria bacterium]|nr:hypothetical protein [Deltaproteobacteria bacterium]